MNNKLPRIPDFRLPSLLKTVNQKILPQWPHALSLCTALNLSIRLGILPGETLGLCEGRQFLLVIEDGGTEAHFTCKGGFFMPTASASSPDVSFRGEFHTYLKLLTRQEDPDTLFFNRQLSIEGDTELGLAIKNLLDAIDWPPPALAALATRLRLRTS